MLTASDRRETATYVQGLQRIASFSSAGTRYYGGDVRGSARSLTDDRGKVTDVASFDAWGVPHDQGDGSARLASLFGFAGERQDATSGLEYLRARWYDPSLGRFLTRDPFPGLRTDPSTAHPFSYAQDAPTTLLDPSGLSTRSLFDQLPAGRFIPVADGCTGQIILIPDFGGLLSEAIFGKRAASFADFGLIPTLACNDEGYVQPVATLRPASCVTPMPGLLQPGPLRAGPGGTLFPGFMLSSRPKAVPGCGPFDGMDSAFYAKAAGKGSSSTKRSSGTASGPPGSLLTEAFRYVRRAVSDLIRREGLPPGSFATPSGDLGSLQATIELSVPPNRELPDVVVRIDVAGLRAAGYEIPEVTRVSNVVRDKWGGVFSMPGGGYQIQFPYRIPPEFITVIER